MMFRTMTGVAPVQQFLRTTLVPSAQNSLLECKICYEYRFLTVLRNIWEKRGRSRLRLGKDIILYLV